MSHTKEYKTRKLTLGALPTPERFHQTGGLRREFIRTENLPDTATLRYRARWASPLDLYREKEILNDAQHQAGLHFGQSYWQTVSGDAACRERSRRIDSPETPDIGDRLREALDYVEQAFAALSSDLINIVIDVCAYDEAAASPEELCKLRKGLGRLAVEWGMASDELCQHRKD